MADEPRSPNLRLPLSPLTIKGPGAAPTGAGAAGTGASRVKGLSELTKLSSGMAPAGGGRARASALPPPTWNTGPSALRTTGSNKAKAPLTAEAVQDWTARLVDGRLSLAEAGGLLPEDLLALGRMAAVQFEAKRFADAAAIFAALAALEHSEPLHLLRLAHAEAALGNSPAAREAALRFVQHPGNKRDDDQISAMLIGVKAILHEDTARVAAEVEALRAFEQQSRQKRESHGSHR